MEGYVNTFQYKQQTCFFDKQEIFTEGWLPIAPLAPESLLLVSNHFVILSARIITIQ